MPGVASREAKRDDRRSRRTRRTLGEALVALMLEKRYDTLTVQEIIDRANVGRSTFYAHYLDKEDLLQNEVAELVGRLVEHMDGMARVDRGVASSRIIPSLELLRHLLESHNLIHALIKGRAMEPALKSMQAHLSLHVERRLRARLVPGRQPSLPLPVVAQYVSGVLLTLFQWWLDQGMHESPEQLNDYFLHLVRPSVLAATGVEM